MTDELQLKFDEQGLIPAIVQDAASREVLMVAYMNEDAVRRTRATGDAWFWSRSRQELWHKGATSGNYQRVTRVRVDCDADAILLEVIPDGPACHTGAVSCFFQSLEQPGGAAKGTEGAQDANGATPLKPLASADAHILDELARVIAERRATMPEGSYVARLLQNGIDGVAKKVGEEAAETIIAAKNGARDQIVWEVADLWFHTLVLLEATGVPVQELWEELARRRR
ncbi:MAG: bifunctional phosphoribosyl-AMP cyclohydrolase/phosphoribosyl-ATP diphosphatase HisIE [Chloroflexi bacterium]|nr:bifunctional phosphoribosyl-AMP cyclohydrolase/phosphoribosyl-ATP diphosphatase HisIE [Chloroflexota bacterium]